MKSTHLTLAIIAVVLVALVVSDVGAEEEGRRSHHAGFGSGMIGRLGGHGANATLVLLRAKEVKAELEITPEQEEALDKLVEQSRSANPSRDGFSFRDMSEKERKAAFEKMQKDQADRIKKMRGQLEEVLLLAQIERLDQISLQARGVQALGDAEVREKLKVSEEQVAKFEQVRGSIQAKMKEKMKALFQAGDRNAMREAFGKLRRMAEEEVLEILSEQQLSQFEEMKGEPFEMPNHGVGRGGLLRRSGKPGREDRRDGERKDRADAGDN